MNQPAKKQFIFLIICVLIIALSAFMARMVETAFGKLEVSLVRIPDPSGIDLTAKLYRPKDASAANPMPGVLVLHGFQNDKETLQGDALELARRGFVSLALDQFGHGDTAFSSADDPTLGGDAAYDYLKALPYVDADRMGILGHSMGASNTIDTALANPDHRALNPQCGNPGTPDLNNVLLTQAQFEEFSGTKLAAEMTTDPERLAQFGLPAPVEYDTLYGNFADGSARKQALIPTVHPGITHSKLAKAEMLLWMKEGLKDGITDPYWIDENRQVFMWKEAFMFLGMLTALVSMIPLTNLLVKTRFFADVAQPLPNRYTAGKKWAGMAFLNNFIAGLTWPFLAAIGGYFLVQAVPSLKMMIGNGLMVWYIFNFLIYLVIFSAWYKKANKNQGVTMYDMGISFDEQKTRLRWDILLKTVLLAAILFGWLYGLTAISQTLLGIEFRILWPFMRLFTNGRFTYFWIYLLPAFLFFLFNGGILLFGQARQKEYDKPWKTQVVWWLKNLLAAVMGLLVVWAFQYIPFFLGTKPGFDLVGLSLFSGMIPLLLFVYIPEFIVLFFFLTWFYRRTGKVYLGALVIAALAMWWLTAGTALQIG